MRVLMTTDYFPPHHGGGVEVVVYELAKRLVGRDHEVRVLTLNTSGSPARETIDGIEVRRYPSIQLTRYLGLQLSIPRGMWSDLGRQVQEFKPDLISSHNLFFTSTVLTAFRGKTAGIPLITTLHLGSVDSLGGWKGLLAVWYERVLGKLILARSDFVIGVSQAVVDHARTLDDDLPVAVVPNGVDLERFRPVGVKVGRARNEAEAVTGIFVGRLLVNKGPHFLVEAMTALAAQHPNLRLLIVGNGPLLEELTEQARHHGIEEQIDFLGLRSDVQELLRRADFFVRPSLLEGMPLTVLEAMASGLPVIASDVAGTGEVVVDGESGLLVPPGDVAGLVAAISRLVEDRDLRLALGRAARRRVEQAFSWDVTTDAVELIFENVVGGKA